ncbi:MAG: AraC family transcriptional regulator [Saprospiraceae bacterium]|nr:AraC family transcriptional regulator [Saprospiraceae bacterium]
MPHTIARYDFSHEDMERSGFKLYQLKTNQLKWTAIPHFPQQTSIPHCHNFYEVCIFFEASGTHDIDFTPHPIKSNSIHIIAPSSVHLIKSNPLTEGFIIAFSPSFYEAFAQKNHSLAKFAFYDLKQYSPVINLDLLTTTYVKNWLANLMQDYVDNTSLANSLLWSHLNLLLWRIHSTYKLLQPLPVTEKPIKVNLLEKFKQLVEVHYLDKHQVQDYAKLLFVSPGQLNRVVKNMSGRTAISIIQDRIVLEAKRLLSYSELTNQEIAFQLQFSDPSYFTKLFKRRTTMTPNEFRNLMRKG